MLRYSIWHQYLGHWHLVYNHVWRFLDLVYDYEHMKLYSPYHPISRDNANLLNRSLFLKSDFAPLHNLMLK